MNIATMVVEVDDAAQDGTYSILISRYTLVILRCAMCDV